VAAFHCPVCLGHEHKRQGPSHPAYLFYALMPSLAFNEIVLGQCMPREMLVCTRCDAPLVDRSYVRCPSCDTLHLGRVWSKSNAFGHWFGLVCPTCGGAIPRLWNVGTLAVLALTAPIWWLPARALRPKYVAYERRRAKAAASALRTSPKKLRWLVLGLYWGLACGVLFSLMTAWVDAGGRGFLHSIVHALAVNIPIWLASGLAFAGVMRLTAGARPFARLRRRPARETLEKLETDLARLVEDRDAEVAQAEDCERRATGAVEENRDDLARAELEQRRVHERRRVAIDEEHAEGVRVAAALREAVASAQPPEEDDRGGLAEPEAQRANRSGG
jgi:hypothetical protein